MKGRLKLDSYQTDKILSINANPLNFTGETYVAALEEGLRGVLTGEMRAVEVVEDIGIDKDDFNDTYTMIKESMSALLAVDYTKSLKKGSLSEDDFQAIYGAGNVKSANPADVEALRNFFVKGSKPEMTQEVKDGIAVIKHVFEAGRDFTKTFENDERFIDVIKLPKTVEKPKDRQMEMSF